MNEIEIKEMTASQLLERLQSMRGDLQKKMMVVVRRVTDLTISREDATAGEFHSARTRAKGLANLIDDVEYITRIFHTRRIHEEAYERQKGGASNGIH